MIIIKEFEGYTVVAQVYDINSKKVFEKSVKVDLPLDGVANDVLTIRFQKIFHRYILLS